MSGRLARLIAKFIPFDVRYNIVMAEFVRTPKGDYNSMGTSVESVLRNMKLVDLAKKKGMLKVETLKIDNVEVVRINSKTAAEAAKWCGGRLVEEIDALDSSKRFPAVNVPTRGGVVRASEGDYVVKHSGGFGKVSHEEYVLMFGSED